ncbi:hypothetical protein VHA01S_032_00250 [Vibrio halioticoli NBRC 102217]|uniref:Glycosyltransferase 2-like domain-containing protein n=1 Tax=Vibrio halioticoli NBRC 102217 TaxID=1219072 RepID=V5HLK4_9VIBR|nr:glycosyltransferase family 2 protein [Vibrio halioticoli]GAD90075.1 hypothetical protein VHA01S_032_00250 [Vibrio halioticoli NBRC 102217]
MQSKTDEIGVTIAIPFFNAERFLLDAIKSVMFQTHSKWELFLIDDGSTDSSLDIAKSINDSRVTVLSDGKNKKLASRLNEVTDLARYNYIARMDADDLMSPFRLEKQLKLMIDNPHIDLTSTGMYSIKSNNTIFGYRGMDFNTITKDDLILKKKGILHASVLAKKDWYLRNKYNESISLGQDVELWIRASSKYDLSVISISEPLYFYREEYNVTKNKLLKAYMLEREVLSCYIDSELYKKLYLAKSLLKSLTVNILSLCGLLHILLKSRNNFNISRPQYHDFSIIIEKLNKFSV